VVTAIAIGIGALALAALLAFVKWKREPTCSCLKFIGDDVNCPEHGV